MHAPPDRAPQRNAQPALWNIFCRVIDNFGDIGICWRLAADLAARGQSVRLWVDDPSALDWMAPEGRAGVEVRAWTAPLNLHGAGAGNLLVEAFGCTVPDSFVALFSEAIQDRCTGALGTFHAWVNLEYLSAEPFARRAHGMPSPVLFGPGAGLTKYFFYPGFTPDSGGLIREPDLLDRQAGFDPAAWLAAREIPLTSYRLVSLFCYEPAAVGALLDRFASDSAPTRLLVTAGRAAAAVQALIGADGARGSLAIDYLPHLSQTDYDHLLWACDLNFVRGEDSVARALWAGRPFVWQIYPQHDGVHATKLGAFLDWLGAPESLARFHRVWNGLEDGPLPDVDRPGWSATVLAARARLLGQDDLTTRLLRFVAGSR